MSLYSKLRGTLLTLFQIGKGGPQLKNNTGVIEARNAGDSAFAILRAAVAASDDDVVTRRLIGFPITLGRDQLNANDEWLRGDDGIPTNLSPVRIPFDAKLIAISATTTLTETWDAEVYDGATSRAGGIPADGSKLTELAIVGVNSAHVLVDVDIAAGSELGVFARGSGISRPRVVLWLIRR